MNRIIKSHLASFAHEYELDKDKEEQQFEKFANFVILSGRISSRFMLDEVTTENNDDGIDGVAVIINEELVVSKEDAEGVFAHERRNNEVELIFIQAKTSEKFDLGDFLKFKESVLRFVESDTYEAESQVQRDAKAVFDVVVDNASKVRDGRPSISVVFATTGTYRNPKELEKAKEKMITQVQDLNIFKDIDVKFMGNNEIIKAWVASYSGINATLDMSSNAFLPTIAGVNEAYLVVVKATDYVKNVLTNEDGTIRAQLFEENVRHFLGSDNQVNMQIAETLKNESSKSMFPVLNNGVTIVSPNIEIRGAKLYISNYQIVNGCQTSYVLYENKDVLSDDVMVTLKVVETTDEDVFSELVRATNSQSKIEKSQFFSLNPVSKRIETYFNTYDGQDGRLYFERRYRQYVNKGIAALRIVSLQMAAKCVCSMFLRRPDLAYRYQKEMYNSFGDKIFSEKNKEIIYYASSLVLYRFHILTSNSYLPANARRFKWHILPLVAEIVSGREIPDLASKKIEKYCDKIINLFSKPSDQVNKVFMKAIDAINSLGEVSDDRLKRQNVFSEMQKKLYETQNQNNK